MLPWGLVSAGDQLCLVPAWPRWETLALSRFKCYSGEEGKEVLRCRTGALGFLFLFSSVWPGQWRLLGSVLLPFSLCYGGWGRGRPRCCSWMTAGQPLRLEDLTVGLGSFPSRWFVSWRKVLFPRSFAESPLVGAACSLSHVLVLSLVLRCFLISNKSVNLLWAGTQPALVCLLLGSWHGVFVNSGPVSEASLCLCQLL